MQRSEIVLRLSRAEAEKLRDILGRQIIDEYVATRCYLEIKRQLNEDYKILDDDAKKLIFDYLAHRILCEEKTLESMAEELATRLKTSKFLEGMI